MVAEQQAVRHQALTDAAWLRQKYGAEGLSTYQIAKLVGHDPKTVYSWLKRHGIPTRVRRWSNRPDSAIPYQSGDWLREEYVVKGRSTGEIAAQFGVTDANILYFLQRAGIGRRDVSQARDLKYWGPIGEANPMYGKRGPENPHWKGGCTPERQALYTSPEWTDAVKKVWKRDKGICRRCGKKTNEHGTPHIHHVISFAVTALRADPANLVLLCSKCHYFVHSRRNTRGEFIEVWEGGDVNATVLPSA